MTLRTEYSRSSLFHAQPHRTFPAAIVLLYVSVTLIAVRHVNAQSDNPVYIDDSPRTYEMFLQARGHLPDNETEAVRLLQQILNDHANVLIPVDEESTELFTSARNRVIDELSSNRGLLRRYQQLQEPSAAASLGHGILLDVSLKQSMTPSGLQALLRLAQYGIESARFDIAVRWLDEVARHPNCSERDRALESYLRGLAAYARQEQGAVQDALQQLTTNPTDLAAICAVQLRRATVGDEAPEPNVGRSSLDRGGRVELTDIVGEPIWRVALPETLFNRFVISQRTNGDFDEDEIDELNRLAADRMTVVPTVAGSTVYVNEGNTIRAVDRFSDRPLWTHQVYSPIRTQVDINSIVGDLNTVQVVNDTLVTLTGHARSEPTRARDGKGRSDRGQIVCLNANDGTERWRKNVESFGEWGDFEFLFPHGTPIIAEGCVYVLIRKITQQRLSTCYLLCLDARSGDMLWLQHIASSGSVRLSTVRPFTSVTYDSGDVFVATPLGAIACISASTGHSRWLRKFTRPAVRYPSYRPWENFAPVVTPHGIIAFSPDYNRVLLLDRSNGRTVIDQSTNGGRPFDFLASSSESYNEPKYFLSDETHVYSIGQDIRAFKHGDLSEPRWVFPDDDAPFMLERDEPFEILGRVQLIDGALVVPTPTSVVLIGTQSGHARREVETGFVGNPLAVDSQLIVAGRDELVAYMPFEVAESMLRRTIATEPGNLESYLSLVHLGQLRDDAALSLEAADLLISHLSSLPHGPETRATQRRLFDLLLQHESQRNELTSEIGERFFATVGMLAVDSRQRIQHVLAYADWLKSTSKTSQAVEVLQTILLDDLLANARYSDSSVERRGDACASLAIASIIEQYGQSVYAPQDHAAHRQLIQLGPEPDVEALLRMARRYPHSSASLDAAIRASEWTSRSGASTRAVAQLASYYMLVPEHRDRAKLLEVLLSLSIATQQTDIIQSTLRHIQYIDDESSLLRRQELLLQHEHLLRDDLVYARPAIGEAPSQESVTLNGSLVTNYFEQSTSVPTDRFLLASQSHLECIQADTLERMWITEELRFRAAPKVLMFSAQQLLLWMPHATSPGAIMLNPVDGSIIWESPPLRNIMARTRPQAPPPGSTFPDGTALDPYGVLPIVHDASLYVVRHNGDVAVIDLATGDVKSDLPLIGDEVYDAVATPAGVVVAGRTTSTSDHRNQPRIALLREDGSINYDIPTADKRDVQWMTPSAFGMLMYGTASGVHLLDVLGRRHIWAIHTEPEQQTLIGTCIGDVVMAVNARNRLIRLPVLAPASIERLQIDRFDDQGWQADTVPDVRAEDGDAVVMFNDRFMRLDHAGELIGRDYLSEERAFLWLLPAEERYVIVSKHDQRQRPIGVDSRTQHQTIHSYRLYTLSPNGRFEHDAKYDQPINPFVSAGVVNGWLLLSPGWLVNQTVAVPYPDES